MYIIPQVFKTDGRGRFVAGFPDGFVFPGRNGRRMLGNGRGLVRFHEKRGGGFVRGRAWKAFLTRGARRAIQTVASAVSR